MMSKIVFLFILVFVQTSFAKTASTVLESMTLTYSQVEFMKSSFNKKSTSILLGSVEQTNGDLEYSKKKFRLEIKGKERHIFIKGKEFFWNVSGKTVLKGNVSKAVPTVFESIFSDPTIWSEMKTSIIKEKKDVVEIKVDTNGKVPNIKEMTLKINDNKKTLLSLSYKDDVNNAVDISFKKIRFFNKSKPSRFVYKIKKTDEVSQM